VMIEDAHRAHGRGAEILGVLESNVIDLEQNDRLTGGIATGETLARVVADTAELADWSPDSRPWLIVDQNGEYYRAHEWGCALTRLVEHHSGFHQPVLWYPVMSVGDTGAACGIVQLSMALEAFRRGYAPAPRVVLLAAADSGHRSATLVAGGPLF
jgi:3-oxoacyl-[acyl-carrier-protein] synthase I